jgi:hypothetical protein
MFYKVKSKVTNGKNNCSNCKYQFDRQEFDYFGVLESFDNEESFIMNSSFEKPIITKVIDTITDNAEKLGTEPKAIKINKNRDNP